MKKMKLGTKIISGFIVILILLMGVAYFGYSGLAGVIDRVDKADDVNRLVKGILQTRQNEKNFIIRGDNASVTKVNEIVESILAQADETKAKFAQKINRDQMDQIKAHTGEYRKAFHRYVELSSQKNETMTEMRALAGEALTQIEALRSSQKSQLAEGRKTQAAFIADKMAKADDANRMIKWFLDTRKNEKEFIISNEQKWLENVHQNIDKILELSADLKSRFKQQTNINQVAKFMLTVGGYKEALAEFVRLTRSQGLGKDSMMAEMRSKANEVLAQAEAIRADQRKQLAVATKENEAFLEDKMTKADDANRMSIWFLDARKSEKEFIISLGETKWLDAARNRVADILKLSESLKSRLKHRGKHRAGR